MDGDILWHVLHAREGIPIICLWVSHVLRRGWLPVKQ